MNDKGKGFTDSDRCILPKLCLEGGDHEWTCCCEKCGMKILYNPEATIGKKPQAVTSKE